MRKRSIRVGVRFNQSEHEEISKTGGGFWTIAGGIFTPVSAWCCTEGCPATGLLQNDAAAIPHWKFAESDCEKAHVLNVMDVKRYDEAVAEFEQAVKIITEAVILPKEK